MLTRRASQMAAARWRARQTLPGACWWARPCLKAYAGSAVATNKKKIVFLGTPEVAALVLRELLQASRAPDATFEVAAVVTQPGKPKGRGNKAVPTPSEVEAAARAAGVPEERILRPATARDPEFLSALAALQPDLAVTAAYGNMLPRAFLDLPRHGTLNIHPSLLPAFRGAAPVQRAVEEGVPVTGVSVAFTVLRCDAGPVLAQRQRAMAGDDVTAPELLEELFATGARLLLEHLPGVWDGTAAPWPQDEAAASHAPKLTKEEGVLDWALPARRLHNRVRAFAGWPGTLATFLVGDAGGEGGWEPLTVKVLQTCVPSAEEVAALQLAGDALADGGVAWGGPRGGLLAPCSGGGVLEVLRVQPPTKKPMAAKDLRNGLGQRQLRVQMPGRRDTSAAGREAAAAAGSSLLPGQQAAAASAQQRAASEAGAARLL